MPLTVTMDAAQSVIAVFSPLFVDVTAQVSWNANWVFEPGAHYLVDRGYLDFERLYGIGSAGSFFVTRAKKNTLFMRRYSRPADKAFGLRSDQEGVLCGVKAPKQYPAPIRRVTYRDPKTDKTAVLPVQQHADPSHRRLPTLQDALAGRTLLQMDQAAPPDQTFSGNLAEHRPRPNPDRLATYTRSIPAWRTGRVPHHFRGARLLHPHAFAHGLS